VAPTPTPTTIDTSAQTGLELVQAEYVSGANPLQVGQSTRIRSTWTLTNRLSVAIDVGRTVEMDLGPEVTSASATVTAGNVAVSGRRVTWDGFVLGPGESASLTLTTDVTPAASSAGRGVVVVEGSLTTARVSGGGLVEVRGGALTSDLVRGLANGGLVTASAVPLPAPVPVAPAPGPAAPAPAAPAPGVTVAAPRPAAVGGPAPAPAARLPSAGTGLVADSSLSMTGAVIGLGAAMAALGLGAVLLRRRSVNVPARTPHRRDL